jgi:hypothetical protein
MGRLSQNQGWARQSSREKNNTLPTYNKIANEMSHPYPVDQTSRNSLRADGMVADSNRKNRCNDRIRQPGDHSNDDLEIVLALLKQQAKADEL